MIPMEKTFPSNKELQEFVTGAKIYKNLSGEYVFKVKTDYWYFKTSISLVKLTSSEVRFMGAKPI